MAPFPSNSSSLISIDLRFQSRSQGWVGGINRHVVFHDPHSPCSNTKLQCWLPRHNKEFWLKCGILVDNRGWDVFPETNNRHINKIRVDLTSK